MKSLRNKLLPKGKNMKEEEESIDKYLYYKRLIYEEILDDTKEELDEATEIKNNRVVG